MANLATGDAGTSETSVGAVEMKDTPAAIVVFVKTPGISAIKTRLADGLGREEADEFYRLSVAAVSATVAVASASQGVSPYWAVAEVEGMGNRRWERFPQIHQGNGGLGQRLRTVFCKLQQRHRIVVVIGADSPQISPGIIGDAFRYLQRDDANEATVLGRCHDGGFYLAGTNLVLPPEVWADVPFSAPNTANRLAANMMAHGKLFDLPMLTDVDDIRDLQVLRRELLDVRNPSPEQAAILNWVMRQFSRLNP
jgi:hypothetical protein